MSDKAREARSRISEKGICVFLGAASHVLDWQKSVHAPELGTTALSVANTSN
jgi:hypothetical protein